MEQLEKKPAPATAPMPPSAAEREAETTPPQEDHLQDLIERAGIRLPQHKDRRRQRCTLPCDNMTEEQLQAMNGPVHSWNLNAPMTPGIFRTMPEDLQDLYLLGLQKRIFGKEPAK